MTTNSSRPDKWDLLLLLGSLLGIFVCSLAVLGMLTTGVVSWLNEDFEGAELLLWSAFAVGFIGALGLPALYYSGRSIFHAPVAASRWSRAYWVIGLFLYPMALALGYFAFAEDTLTSLLGPIAHLFAAVSPVLIIVFLSRQIGPTIRSRRAWGHFLTGLWGVPPLALLSEMVTLVPMGFFAFLMVSLTPKGLQLMRELASLEMADPSTMDHLVLELIQQPPVLITVFLFISFVVPLVEEGLKSIAIWPLLPRKLTPSEAFLGGLLGGAGYALFESLLLPQPGSDWIATMIGRTGTPFIHAFNTGLVCWGLNQAFSQGKWLQMIYSFAGAVFLHGLWNAGAIGIGVSLLTSDPDINLISTSEARIIATLAAILLAALASTTLLGSLQLLRRFTRRVD